MPVDLHPRLEQDSHQLGVYNDNLLLLMRNALFPWFVIVPDTREVELHRLPGHQQTRLFNQVIQVSSFIEAQFQVDKINVASIGNLVPQLHVHIIGRRQDDACWPGVVWGTDKFDAYSLDDVAVIRHHLAATLGETFRN